MARKSPNRPNADEPDQELAETSTELDDAAGSTDATASAAVVDDDGDAVLDEDAVDGDADPVTSDADRSPWDETRIEPVEIALPSGAGFTLRAYRLSTELTPTDIGERDEDDLFAARARRSAEEDDEAVVILDDEDDDEAEDDLTDSRRSRSGRAKDADDDDAEALDAEEQEEEEEPEPEPAGEDVPIFLTNRGKLLLFKTPESLVTFVRSGAPHDLTQLDTWDQLAERIQPADIAPLDEDSYELDLVVENLRGGHDTWDPTLLIEAGEAARDLAYALRLPSVLDMLSSGSSLDDLDEALRATVNGGIGGFMGRRRLRKIGAQTASLGWRTIIGKISAAVDWRD